MSWRRVKTAGKGDASLKLSRFVSATVRKEMAAGIAAAHSTMITRISSANRLFTGTPTTLQEKYIHVRIVTLTVWNIKVPSSHRSLPRNSDRPSRNRRISNSHSASSMPPWLDKPNVSHGSVLLTAANFRGDYLRRHRDLTFELTRAVRVCRGLMGCGHRGQQTHHSIMIYCEPKLTRNNRHETFKYRRCSKERIVQ